MFARIHKACVHAVLALASLAIGCSTAAQAQTISPSTDLSFGAFVPGTGGTVVVSPAGVRSQTGGVALLTVAQFPAAAAASFAVTNTANNVKTYTIALPATSVTLTRTGFSDTMSVGSFVSNPAAGTGNGGKGNGTISNANTGSFTVGATLTVGNAQPAGSYTGTFSVTVTYP